jgi:peroxiredoxin
VHGGLSRRYGADLTNRSQGLPPADPDPCCGISRCLAACNNRLKIYLYGKPASLMKYLVILTFPFLLITNLNTQVKKRSPRAAEPISITRAPTPKATAVIKGNVKNFTDKYWEMLVTGDLNNYSLSIAVDQKGNFSKTIELDDETEDLYLYLNNDALTLCARKNDTIEVSWDNKDFEKTIKVSSISEGTNSRLQAFLAIYRLYRSEYLGLAQSLYSNNITDSAKYKQINTLYNKEMLTAARDRKYYETRKLTTDVYYKYNSLLISHGLLNSYSLLITDTSALAKKLNSEFPRGIYAVESAYALGNSNVYKEFLLTGVVILGYGNDRKFGTVPLSPAWQQYYWGLSNFKFYQTRDWFIAKQIMFAFENYSFDEVSAVYNDFMTKVKIPRYADSLRTFYKKMQLLKPGYPAPAFSLKNDKGEIVTLKSLRGKVVYIDFWGVGGAPCINEIKNYTATLHQKYEDKGVVFLNICVDSDEKTWKQSMASLKMTGVNVIAEGWTRNPVCQQYNIKGIPHYIMIDANGKIVNNNSPRPSEKAELYVELDKALK